MVRALICGLILSACAETTYHGDDRPVSVIVSDPLEITRILAADEMEGRETGTVGNKRARAWLLDQMRARPFDALADDYQHSFEVRTLDKPPMEGVNLIGLIPGTSEDDGPAMIITAHYDHVGVKNGEIYNGADDNASGVAGALAIADHFFANPPVHDVVIAFLDAEEMGLLGAQAFLRDEIVPAEGIALNVNLDMISKNDQNELYAAGAFHTPELRPLLEGLSREAPITLKQGHDRPELGFNDWTLQSDHAPFHKAGIPFVYFGVEDHSDYHQPTDTYDTIPQPFFLGSVETIVMAAELFDEALGDIARRQSQTVN